MAKRAVAKKEAGGVPAELMEELEGQSGAGFEDTDADDYAIPFVAVLQKGSPQVDPDDGAYINGAKPGLFYNTVTGELFKDITVIPCARRREFVEWVPRDEGGGLIGRHDPDSDVVLNCKRDGLHFTPPIVTGKPFWSTATNGIA